jgi:hypothetical protein
VIYEIATYKGDDVYTINCTGDAVVGDQVRFQRAEFGGSYRKPKFLGFSLVSATIVADSYGADKQQHTFTLRLSDGSTTRIKGRNLYREGVYRRPWDDESARHLVADEKHSRGKAARAARAARIEDRLTYEF